MAFNAGLKAALPVMDLWESVMPYFRPAESGAENADNKIPNVISSRIDQGSFAGGIPPTSKRLHGADDLMNPNSPSQFAAELYIFEDNMSTITVLEKGSSHKLAHMTRTHRVNFHWFAEVCSSQGIHVGHIPTDTQARDIFTEAFTDPVKWNVLCSLVGMYKKEHVQQSKQRW